MPTFVFFEDGQPKPVSGVEKVRPSQSVVTKDNGVERIRGADHHALTAVIKTLGLKARSAAGVEEAKAK